MRRSLIIAAGVIALSLWTTLLMVQASGILIGSAFRHEDNVLKCGTPVASITWPTKQRALQRFQRCSIVATYATVTPVPVNTAVPPTVEPTQIRNTPTPMVFPSATPAPTSTDPNAARVQYELNLLNTTRVQYGRRPLALNATQSNGAGSCVAAWTYGENVGMAGFGNYQTDLSALHQQMMGEIGSPPNPALCTPTTVSHACNILNANYSQVGIGIVESGGATWLTTDFTS